MSRGLTIRFLQSEPTLSQNLLVNPPLTAASQSCALLHNSSIVSTIVSHSALIQCFVCLIDISHYVDHFLKGFCRLVGPTNVFLWWNWTNNLGNRKFPSIASDTCWTYANEFNTDLSDWMLPAPLLLLGSGQSFCTVLAMCAHLFRHPYTLCVQISNISMWTTLMKMMLICGLHWHSRYSIVDFYIVLLHFRVVYRDLLWPTSTKCG